MRLIFWSNAPFVNTGYGIQVRHVLPRLKELGHDVAVISNYGLTGSVIEWDGVTIYPLQEQRHNADVLHTYTQHFKADALISLYDIWSLPNNSKELMGVPWIGFIPVDGSPISERMLERIKYVDWPISYSPFGKNELMKMGIETDYLPHAIDCDLYKPFDKIEARKRIGFPEDRYIITVVAANKGTPPRKSWPEILAAFKLFNDSFPKSMLYCHTTKSPFGSKGDGIYFEDLMRKTKLRKGTIAFPNRGDLAIGINDGDMAKVYQASDMFLLPSRGEGFGLPLIEAQACGIPVVSHDCSSCTELVVNGKLVSPGHKQYISSLGYYWRIPSVEGIYEAMIDVYNWSDEKKKEMSEAGREHALEYNLEHVWEKHWIPFLQKVEDEIW